MNKYIMLARMGFSLCLLEQKMSFPRGRIMLFYCSGCFSFPLYRLYIIRAVF
jgi:hypothetical protein